MNIVVLFGSTLLLSMAQGAQTLTIEQTLQYCANIEDNTDRLACFEGLAQAVASDPSPNSEAVSELDRTAPPSAGDNAAPVTATAPATPENGVAQTKKPRIIIMRADELEEERKAAAKAAAPKKNRAAYRVTVLKSWRYSATNQQYIAMTNGEIWKQIDSRRGRTIKNGQEITIKPGAISGWLLVFDDKRPAMRVSLVR